jgi:anaerobic ribonucleoside-triphosphate reductase activating protein
MLVGDFIASIGAWLDECDGVTVSGGEPFDQPDALSALLQALRHQWPEHDVLVYSGYAWENLRMQLGSMTGLIDALMSDPFELEQPQTLRLRGSDNQRLHLLTERGKARFQDYDGALLPGDRTLDIAFDADGTVWMAGVPLRRDLQRLRELLEQQGHKATVSEQRME